MWMRMQLQKLNLLWKNQIKGCLKGGLCRFQAFANAWLSIPLSLLSGCRSFRLKDKFLFPVTDQL